MMPEDAFIQTDLTSRKGMLNICYLRSVIVIIIIIVYFQTQGP